MIDPNDFDESPAVAATAPTRDVPCPHCEVTRPSRSRLAAHVYWVHRHDDTSDRMAEAKRDIAAMSHALTDVAERMQRLDDAESSPAVVRRRTLNDVVDRLREAGDYAGCATVQRMILQEGE